MVSSEDIKYQESGNLELDVRLLEYIRGLKVSCES
jgi:hypothetical protein